MARSKTRRSVCPVACALDLLGDRWTLLVVRDLWAGKSTWSALLAAPEGIATNILADRLAALRAGGFVARAPGSERRGSYRLTAKGRRLLPVLAALRDWGLANIAGTEARVAPGPVG